MPVAANRAVLFDAEVAQHICDVRGHKDGRRAFREHDLVRQRLERVDNLGLPRALGHAQAADFVVERMVPRVGRQRFDHGINSLGARHEAAATVEAAAARRP